MLKFTVFNISWTGRLTYFTTGQVLDMFWNSVYSVLGCLFI